jgi:hypothetical protein
LPKSANEIVFFSVEPTDDFFLSLDDDDDDDMCDECLSFFANDDDDDVDTDAGSGSRAAYMRINTTHNT